MSQNRLRPVKQAFNIYLDITQKNRQSFYV